MRFESLTAKYEPCLLCYCACVQCAQVQRCTWRWWAQRMPKAHTAGGVNMSRALGGALPHLHERHCFLRWHIRRDLAPVPATGRHMQRMIRLQWAASTVHRKPRLSLVHTLPQECA